MSVRIVVVGSLNMDLVAQAPHLPVPGETIIGSTFDTIPGGKGANQAVAAARLGAQVSMVGCVGDDDFGRQLLANLDTDQIDRSGVQSNSQCSTGIALIEVDDAGQNSIVVVPGANGLLSPEQVEAAMPILSAADVLLLQLETPLPAVERAAKIAAGQGVTVILNPAPAQPLSPNLLSTVDILIPNETELQLLTGVTSGSIDQVVEGARRLRASEHLVVVVTLGGQGALLVGPEETTLVPAFEVNPVDTTAAGDAFVAGFAVALAEGVPLASAVRWGNAAGALAATKSGAQSSLPTRQSLEHLLQALGLH